MQHRRCISSACGLHFWENKRPTCTIMHAVLQKITIHTGQSTIRCNQHVYEGRSIYQLVWCNYARCRTRVRVSQEGHSIYYAINMHWHACTCSAEMESLWAPAPTKNPECARPRAPKTPTGPRGDTQKQHMVRPICVWIGTQCMWHTQNISHGVRTYIFVISEHRTLPCTSCLYYKSQRRIQHGEGPAKICICRCPCTVCWTACYDKTLYTVGAVITHIKTCHVLCFAIPCFDVMLYKYARGCMVHIFAHHYYASRVESHNVNISKHSPTCMWFHPGWGLVICENMHVYTLLINLHGVIVHNTARVGVLMVCATPLVPRVESANNNTGRRVDMHAHVHFAPCVDHACLQTDSLYGTF